MNVLSSVLLFGTILLSSPVAKGSNNAPPVAFTKYGPVRGSVKLSRHGRPFNSFRGIPFAQPPIGPLRFKAPVAPHPWNGTLDATKEGPYCIQKNYIIASPADAKVEGQEDCLYLNIYVPRNPACKRPLPVMVFIHWGGFFAGRGTSDYFGPDYFMDKDVILVTFNYRLAVMGFLSTLDDASPGNYALKDQVMVLRFVRDNIANFGGDKGRVTLFGQSAGAGSSSYHLVSPMSRGLFQAGMSQSGNSLAVWAKLFDDIKYKITLANAQFVGCGKEIGDNWKLVECLRKVDAETLVQSGDLFKFFSIEPFIVYGAVAEVKTARNPEPFLTKQPLDYFQSGDFAKVPWIHGITQDEGILRVTSFVRTPEYAKVLQTNFTDLVPKLLGLSLSVPETEVSSLWRNITDFYFDGSIDLTDKKSIQAFIDLYTDRLFAYGMYQQVKLQRRNNNQPIWIYNFDYKGDFSFENLFAATKEKIDFDWGVSHCDELLYLFKSPALFPKQLISASDMWLSNFMISLWTNFATYGRPDPANNLNWPLAGDHYNFLNITGGSAKHAIRFELQDDFLWDRMQFWEKQAIAENVNVD